jgi:hypothetical protein
MIQKCRQVGAAIISEGHEEFVVQISGLFCYSRAHLPVDTKIIEFSID